MLDVKRIDSLLTLNATQRVKLQRLRLYAECEAQGIDIKDGLVFSWLPDEVRALGYWVQPDVPGGPFHTRCRKKDSEEWIILDPPLTHDGRKVPLHSSKRPEPFVDVTT